MKIACIALPLVILASNGIHPSAKLDERAVLARYKKECAKKEVVTRSCKRQKRFVEGIYYRSFRRLTAPRKIGAVERKYMVAAAKADFLALRELGLWTLAAEGTKRGPQNRVSSVVPEPGFLTSEEEKLYVAELNSPYPALRKVAWDALLTDRYNSTRKLDETKWGVDRDYRKEFGTSWNGAPQGLSEDRAPHPDQLRAKTYPTAELLYYASGKGGAIWLTHDSVETVLAHYEEQGFESMPMKGAFEMAKKLQKAKMEEIVQKMKSGGDPQAMQKEWKAIDLTKGLVPSYVFVDPKDQFVIGKEKTVAGTKMIEYQLVIWDSKELGKTGIAIEFKDRK